jgi:hypothetical protein
MKAATAVLISRPWAAHSPSDSRCWALVSMIALR